MKVALSVVSGLLILLALGLYILAIRRGETKPAKASWVIWATLDTIILAGMLASGTVSGQMIGAVVGIWIVVAFSLKYGESGWTSFDKLCLGGAVLGIILWAAFKSPALGVLASASTLFLGGIPTFVSAWKNPRGEDRLAWIIFWVSALCALLAVPSWTIADAAAPIVFFAIESIVMVIVLVRPRSCPPKAR